MKLLQTPFIRTGSISRKRYDASHFADWVITETIETFTFMYPVDTWYLPDFERIILGIADYVEPPVSWKSIAYWILCLGDEIMIFYTHLYISFVVTKSLAFTWQWHNWTVNHGLSTYSWGVYQEDIMDNEDLDYNNTRFLTIYPLSFNAENSCALLWGICNTKIINIFSCISSLVKVSVTSKLSYVYDSLFGKSIRFTFRVRTYHKFLNYTSLFLTRLVAFIYKKVSKKTRGSHIVTQNLNLFFNKADFSLNIISSFLDSKKITKFFNKTIGGLFIIKPVNFSDSFNTTNTASLLRKQRVFTKSKYSRSRQYCKNIVFLGLLLNIILMFGLNSGYYAILINTGYFLIPLYVAMVFYSIYIFFKFKLFSVFKFVC